MKRFVLLTVFLIGCLCMNGFIVPPKDVPQDTTQNEVVLPDSEKVFEAHIESLLNLNNIYGDDIYDNEALVNAAAVNLRSYADEFGFIPNGVVTSYIKDIYDIDVEIDDSINVDLPKKEGFVYLIPRGYACFTHEILEILEIDGGLTVTSLVSAKTHDGISVVGTATTVLEANETSSFGYVIVSSYVDYNVSSYAA